MTSQGQEASNSQIKPSLPDFFTDPNAVLKDISASWRYGTPPDYSTTRRFYAESKKANHEAGSLPALVENLVKNWEIEASFKTKLSDWRTINHERYQFSMNGGAAQTGDYMLKHGTYNAILSSNEYYCPKHSDFASSHKTFKRMMPTFAWEVLEVYSGPPTVAFRWRHWGTMKNDYVGFNNKGDKITVKAHGSPIDIQGVTVANLDESMKVVHLETWFDPMDMFHQIAPAGVMNKHDVETEVIQKAESRLPGSPDETIDSAGDKERKAEQLEQTSSTTLSLRVNIRENATPVAGQGEAADERSDETRLTHEEMSEIRLSECPFLNQE